MARAFFRRRKSCPFSGKDAPTIDYKDIRLLQGFVSERGKIVPSRITAVATVAALIALVAAHHRRRSAFVLVDADGEEADDVLVDVRLALELSDRGRRRVEVEHHIMRLAVLGDAVGEGFQAPGLGLDHLAAIVGDDLGCVFRERVDLGLGQVLTRQKDMLIERHVALFLLLADR